MERGVEKELKPSIWGLHFTKKTEPTIEIGRGGKGLR